MKCDHITNVTRTPMIDELYNDESLGLTIEMRGPHPNGTKSLFLEFKPGLPITRRDDSVSYIRPHTKVYEEWLNRIIQINGFVETTIYGDHFNRLEFNLCRYNDRRELLSEILCILRNFHPTYKSKCNCEKTCKYKGCAVVVNCTHDPKTPCCAKCIRVTC